MSCPACGTVRCRTVPCFAECSLSCIPDGNASKRTELAKASMYVLEHFIHLQHAVFIFYCFGLQQTSSSGTYAATNSSTAVFTSTYVVGPRAQQSTAQSPLHKAASQVRADQSTYQKKYVRRTCMLRPVCFPGAWSSWHLPVACLHYKCWTIYLLHLSVIPIHFTFRASVAGGTARYAKRLVVFTSILSPSIIRYLPPPPHHKHCKHSTARHSAVNPRNKQSKYAPIRGRQRRQADGVGSRQHVVERMYIQLAVLKTNEEIKICSVYKNTAGGVMRKGFACTLLFLSLLSTSSTHAAPGLFSGTMELLAFASR